MEQPLIAQIEAIDVSFNAILIGCRGLGRPIAQVWPVEDPGVVLVFAVERQLGKTQLMELAPGVRHANLGPSLRRALTNRLNSRGAVVFALNFHPLSVARIMTRGRSKGLLVRCSRDCLSPKAARKPARLTAARAPELVAP